MDPKDNDRLRILKQERVQHIKAIENIDAEILRIEEGISTEVIEAPSAPTIRFFRKKCAYRGETG